MSDKKTRYSDDELQEFKQIILEKLAKAQRDYELLCADRRKRYRRYLPDIQGA